VPVYALSCVNRYLLFFRRFLKKISGKYFPDGRKIIPFLSVPIFSTIEAVFAELSKVMGNLLIKQVK